MTQTPKRQPNVTCDACQTPMYRRPSTLAMNAKKFCSTGCRNKTYRHTGPRPPRPQSLGENNPAWKGGTYIEPEKGYRMIRMPDHPRARANGYVLEQILVAEKILGRRLRAGEEVHHEDRDRANNDPANLKIYDSHKEHWVTEHLPRILSARSAAASRRRLAGAQH